MLLLKFIYFINFLPFFAGAFRTVHFDLDFDWIADIAIPDRENICLPAEFYKYRILNLIILIHGKDLKKGFILSTLAIYF